MQTRKNGARSRVVASDQINPAARESVVETLVRGQHRGRFRLLLAHAEDLPGPRAPEEHFQREDVEVDERHQRDEDARDQSTSSSSGDSSARMTS